MWDQYCSLKKTIMLVQTSGNIILWNVMLESKLQHTVGLSKKMVPSLEDGNLLTDKNQQLH